MTLQLLINGVDFTSVWRLYESSWTTRAHMGESFSSEFILDDDLGNISHANLAPKKIVEVWEDASGSPLCLYRGRVANKQLGRGALRTNPAMRWRVTVEDWNTDLRGIRIVSMNDVEEDDTDRVTSIRNGFLAGAGSVNPNARDSTNIALTYLLTGSEVLLPAEHYTDTYPDQVLEQIASETGKNFFVYTEADGTGSLYYGGFLDNTTVALQADFELRDDGTADGEDVFAPYWSESTAEHEGQRVLTGAGIRYGDQDDYEEASDVDGGEATYDKWEEHLVNEYVRDPVDAQRHITNTVFARPDQTTYMATIDMRADQVHRIRAGMMVPLLQYASDKPTLGVQRAAQVTYAPKWPDADGNAAYSVTMELGRPRARPMLINRRRRPTAKPIPRPPIPTTPGGDVITGRLYYTDDPDGSSGLTDSDYSTSWDFASSSPQLRRLQVSPQNTLTNTGSGNPWEVTDQAAGTVVSDLFTVRLDETTNLLETIQTGGTFRTIIRSASRVGVGISESAQFNYPDMTARVYRPGTGFIGTLFDVGDGTSAIRFDINDPRLWPTIPFTVAYTGVPSAVSTDYVLLELGGDHVGPVTGGTGFSYRPADSSATDLPFVVDSVADQNAWAEFISTSGGGTAGDGRDDLIGTEDGCYKRCDDTEHFNADLLPGGARAPTADDDVTQGFRVGTHWLNPDTGRVYWLTDNTTGAAVWVLFADLTGGGSGTSLIIEEEDGDPSGVFDTLKVPNDTLTDNGDGSASIDYAAAVHSHVPPTGDGFRGVSVRRTTNFTSTNANTSIPDFDTVEYDTDAFYDAGDPERITIPAAFDGLMFQFYAMGLWATGTDNYTEMKLYRNGTGVEEPFAVTQHVPATSYNTGQLVISRPIQVATGDYFTITFRTPASETVLTYDDMSLVFSAWMVGGTGGGAALSDDTPLVESGSGDPGVSDEGSRSDHVHPAAGGSSGGAILLESGHAVPFTFDEILQESDGSGFLYASE